MQRRILVTGGTGFIGSYVVSALREQGHAVDVFTTSPGAPLLAALRGGDDVQVRFHEGGVEDFDALCARMEETSYDAVVHLAAMLVPDSADNPRKAIDVNVTGSLNVLEAAAQNGVPRMVNASSLSVYAEAQRYPNGVDDDALLQPSSIYGASKAFGEVLLRERAKTTETDVVSLRFGAVFGLGRSLGVSSKVSDLLLRASLGGGVEIPEFGPQIPWQYVVDCAHLVSGAALSPLTFQGAVVNAPCHTMTLKDALLEVAGGAGRSDEVRVVPGRYPWRDLPAMLSSAAEAAGLAEGRHSMRAAGSDIAQRAASWLAAGVDEELIYR